MEHAPTLDVVDVSGNRRDDRAPAAATGEDPGSADSEIRLLAHDGPGMREATARCKPQPVKRVVEADLRLHVVSVCLEAHLLEPHRIRAQIIDAHRLG